MIQRRVVAISCAAGSAWPAARPRTQRRNVSEGLIDNAATSTNSVIFTWNSGCETYQEMPLVPQYSRASPVSSSSTAATR
ncbi:hypothetical protein D3C86_2091910 [compost metagenome]